MKRLRLGRKPGATAKGPRGTPADDRPAKGTRLSAVEIHVNILAPAEEELERPASAASSS